MREKKMNNQGSFLNVRDFGAKASRYTSVIHSAKGSDYYEIDDIGDFEVGDEVYLVGACPGVINKQLYVRRDVSSVNPRPPKRRFMISDEIEFYGYDGEDSDFVVYIVDMCPEMPGIIRWSRDFGRSWTDNVPIIDRKAELDLGRYLIINDFEDYRFGCTAVFVCSARSVSRILEIKGKCVRLSLTASRTAECTIAHSDSFGIQSAVDEAIENNKNVYFLLFNLKIFTCGFKCYL